MKKTLKFLIVAMIIIQMFSLASALNVKSVSTNPSEISPGQEVLLEIVLDNNLGYDVENVEVSIDLSKVPFAPKQSSLQFKESIDDDDQENFRFELISDADSNAGAYEIPVEVSYQEAGVNNVTLTKKFSVSAIVNAKPELNLNSDNFLIQNQKGELEIRITNVGLNKAKLLEVELQSSPLYNILSSNKIYIGDLESDDFDTATFDVIVKQSGNVQFQVVMNYRDARNNEITETQDVAVKSYNLEEAKKLGLVASSNMMIYLSAAVVILVAWMVWRKIKKKKKS